VHSLLHILRNRASFSEHDTQTWTCLRSSSPIRRPAKRDSASSKGESRCISSQLIRQSAWPRFVQDPCCPSRPRLYPHRCGAWRHYGQGLHGGTAVILRSGIGADSKLNQFIASAGVSPVIRIPGDEWWMVKRVLDSGAHGIMVPMCHNAVSRFALQRSLRLIPGHRTADRQCS